MWPLAIAGGLGSLLNFFSQKNNSNQAAQVAQENTDKTILANKQAAQLAYQRDVAQWQRANEYNSPIQQMARLKGAGLNPMLVYGSGSAAGNTSGPSPSMSVPQQNYQYQAAQIPPVDIMALVQGYQSLKATQAQIDNTKANTAATIQKTRNDVIQGALLAVQKVYADRKEAAGTKAAETQAAFMESEKLLDLLMKSTQQAGAQQTIDQQRQLFPYQLDFTKGTVRKQEMDIESIKKSIINMGLQGQKTIADTKLVGKQSDNIDADMKLKAMQLLLNDEDLFQKKWDNWLRMRGMSPTDNPLTYGTRKFNDFIDWAVNQMLKTTPVQKP